MRALSIPIVIAYVLYVNHRINRRKALAEAMLAKISKRDKAWKSPELRSYVRQAFLRIQRAWCRQDLATLKEDLAQDLYRDWAAKIMEMRKRGDRNVMEGLRADVRFVTVRNFKNDAHDSFSVCIDAAATDYIIEKEGRIVSSSATTWLYRRSIEKSSETFREFWTFRRKGRRRWILEQVQQEHAWLALVTEEMINED